MTTLTKEYITQIAKESSGVQIRGVHPGLIGFYPTALGTFVTRVREDLETTIAEQKAEIERLEAAIKDRDYFANKFTDEQNKVVKLTNTLNNLFNKLEVARLSFKVDCGATKEALLTMNVDK